MTLTVVEGSTFCICDELGDVDGETTGFFAEDTRFLSLLRLTVNGARPLLLSSGKVEYFSAAFYMRNPLAGGLPQDALTIVRTRFVGDAMQDHLAIENTSQEPLELELSLELGSDFADIFTVKEHDFSLGHPADAPPLPALAPCEANGQGRELCFADGESDAHTTVTLSKPGDSQERGKVDYRIRLEPRERWELLIDVFPSTERGEAAPRQEEQRFGDELRRVRDSLAAWQLRVPQMRASFDALEHTFDQSVSDLAALRMHAVENGGQLPAAGMPWFMTVFGRDTIITCLQTLLFGPDLARTALEALASLQATEDDPSIDAEPGKIVHEVRHGKAARKWFSHYYGSVDATPLFLVLLSEVWSWTDDRALVNRLRGPALAALRWIDEYGDRDGDGFVEYARRTPAGLENQSWKDSGDSQRYRDGRFAKTPIAPVEVQGYVYDAKRRLSVVAREVWRDRELADRLDREAEELRRRFDEAFWCDDRGGYYALALDADKHRVDSLTSNIGHLLWSGIVPPERADAVVDRLMGEDLWSGWGVRTMSSAEAAYSPLAYHNGTVWPHDNSLIAWGLARYARWPEAHRIIRRMLEAAGHFDWQLPEVFAGLPSAETPFPIPYPTASRPQAWAAGTPILLLQLLLGIQPDRARQALVTVAPLELPSWAGELRLSGVRAFDRQWDVTLRDGSVSIED
ncbi:MAG: amylo-alpha-1,6-glucosidase [Gaiellaceae bacterium]